MVSQALLIDLQPVRYVQILLCIQLKYFVEIMLSFKV